MTDVPPRTRTINVGPNTGNTGNTDGNPGEPDPMNVPRGPASGPSAATDDRVRTPKLRRMETQLREVYAAVGVGASFAGLQFGGMLVAHSSEELAASWIDLAERDPKIAAALERFLASGGWIGVVAAHMAVAAPIAAYYGVLPKQVSAMVLTGMAVTDPEFMAPFADSVHAAQTAAAGMNGAPGH